MQEFIPVYNPALSEKERSNVLDCLNTGWISSKGQYVEEFQQKFCEYTGILEARAVCNGTVAIQVALAVLDLKPGDEIIVPSFTYVASVSPIMQIGAIPVFVTSYADTWLLSVEDVANKITAKTKAIMVPHLYGNVCDMPALCKLAKKHDLWLIEDCAESMGSFIDDKHTGGWGDIATFSFFGNKTITTGEGGMVATNHPDLAHRIRKYCNQGLSSEREYWHDSLGFNYRMTNIQAAIGCAQLEKIQLFCEKKRALAEMYQRNLLNTPLIWQTVKSNVISSYWMVSALCRSDIERDNLRAYLKTENIETRPFFPFVHTMPMFTHLSPPEDTPAFVSRGFNLPSWPMLPVDQQERIIRTIQIFYSELV